MPPCGYRPPAIDGIRQFMADNLDYFVSLYRPRGLSVSEAIATELAEIDRIRSGARGGEWSATVVELNARFYKGLAQAKPGSWDDVTPIGRQLIRDMELDLASLGADPSTVAAE